MEEASLATFDTESLEFPKNTTMEPTLNLRPAST